MAVLDIDSNGADLYNLGIDSTAMSHSLAFIAFLIVAVLLAGCTDLGVEPGVAKRYQYTGYNSEGNAIVRGWLAILTEP